MEIPENKSGQEPARAIVISNDFDYLCELAERYLNKSVDHERYRVIETKAINVGGAVTLDHIDEILALYEPNKKKPPRP